MRASRTLSSISLLMNFKGSIFPCLFFFILFPYCLSLHLITIVLLLTLSSLSLPLIVLPLLSLSSPFLHMLPFSLSSSLVPVFIFFKIFYIHSDSKSKAYLMQIRWMSSCSQSHWMFSPQSLPHVSSKYCFFILDQWQFFFSTSWVVQVK